MRPNWGFHRHCQQSRADAVQGGVHGTIIAFRTIQDTSSLRLCSNATATIIPSRIRATSMNSCARMQGLVDVVLDLNKLRRQRTRLIWNTEQYAMVYRAIQGFLLAVSSQQPLLTYTASK